MEHSVAIVGRTIILRVFPGQRSRSEWTTPMRVLYLMAHVSLTIQRNLASVPLGHHVYEQQLNRWLGHLSKPQPFVRLSVNIEKEDYEHFGFQLSFSPGNILIGWTQDARVVWLALSSP